MFLLSWTWIAFITHRLSCCCFCRRPATRTQVWWAAVATSGVTKFYCRLEAVLYDTTADMLPPCVCKARSPAHDGLGCSFANVHVEREFNIAKSMCGSFVLLFSVHSRGSCNESLCDFCYFFAVLYLTVGVGLPREY